MKPLNSPTLRLAAITAIIAVASGCPSTPTPATSTIHAVKKPSTAPVTSASTAVQSSVAAGTTPAANDGTSAAGASTSQASSSPTSSPVTSASPSAAVSQDPNASGAASPSPTAAPSVSPSPSKTPDAGGGNPTSAPSVTPPSVTPTPVVVGVQGGANVTTFAGTAQLGYSDTNAANALFNSPAALAVQVGKALYVADSSGFRVRRIDLATSGNPVTTVAGSGSTGYRDGIGQSAVFGTINALTLDATGNLYVSDGTNNVIRKIDLVTDPANPNVTTLAGVAQVAGANNGTGSVATFRNPSGLAISGSNLLVADPGNHLIRQVDLSDPNHAVTTLVGSGSIGTANGPGTIAKFSAPVGLALDAQGNLIVADQLANVIRGVVLSDANHNVTTIAGVGSSGSANGIGSSSAFNAPTGVALGSDGALYVADYGNNAIRRIDLTDPNFTTTTYAGGSIGFQDAQGINAKFSGPTGIVALGTTLYVADQGNHRVRLVQ